MRRVAGIELTDRIVPTLPETDADLLAHRDWIAREVLADLDPGGRELRSQAVEDGGQARLTCRRSASFHGSDTLRCLPVGLWVGLAFEDRERCALGIGDHRVPPTVAFGGRQQPVPAQLCGLARGLVSGLDGEIR